MYVYTSVDESGLHIQLDVYKSEASYNVLGTVFVPNDESKYGTMMHETFSTVFAMQTSWEKIRSLACKLGFETASY